MQLFGNRGITGEPPENQSHHDCFLALGKEVTSSSSSFIQSVTFRKKDPLVLHSEAQWLISNKVCKLF